MSSKKSTTPFDSFFQAKKPNVREVGNVICIDLSDEEEPSVSDDKLGSNNFQPSTAMSINNNVPIVVEPVVISPPVETIKSVYTVESYEFPLYPWMKKKSNVANNPWDVSSADIPNNMQLEYYLDRYFKLPKFRELQREVIKGVLARKSGLVLLATGGGKSLCFQLPALLMKGVTIVVSPIISLMQDQVNSMRRKGFPVSSINSSMSQKDQKLVEDDINSAAPETKLLYMAPEGLCGPRSSLLRSLYTRGLLAMFVIDEAHCISQYGHDFRPKYRELGNVISWFPGIPVLALTATATPTVADDIKSQLRISDSPTYCLSFDRPNLSYRVVKKDSLRDYKAEMKRLVKECLYNYDGVGNVPSVRKEKGVNSSKRSTQSSSVPSAGVTFTKLSELTTSSPRSKNKMVSKGTFGTPADVSIIIYAHSKSDVDSLVDELQRDGIPCVSYHAGMSAKDRTETQRLWTSGEKPVIVATIAFGMGIDKPNIRLIIHDKVPRTMEGYYQECGRAGRDGRPSECVLFYTPADIDYFEFLINQKYQKMAIDLKRTKTQQTTNRSHVTEGGAFIDSVTHVEEVDCEDLEDYIDKAGRDRELGSLMAMKEFANPFHCRRDAILDFFREGGERHNCFASYLPSYLMSNEGNQHCNVGELHHKELCDYCYATFGMTKKEREEYVFALENNHQKMTASTSNLKGNRKRTINLKSLGLSSSLTSEDPYSDFLMDHGTTESYSSKNKMNSWGGFDLSGFGRKNKISDNNYGYDYDNEENDNDDDGISSYGYGNVPDVDEYAYHDIIASNGFNGGKGEDMSVSGAANKEKKRAARLFNEKKKESKLNPPNSGFAPASFSQASNLVDKDVLSQGSVGNSQSSQTSNGAVDQGVDGSYKELKSVKLSRRSIKHTVASQSSSFTSSSLSKPVRDASSISESFVPRRPKFTPHVITKNVVKSTETNSKPQTPSSTAPVVVRSTAPALSLADMMQLAKGEPPSTVGASLTAKKSLDLKSIPSVYRPSSTADTSPPRPNIPQEVMPPRSSAFSDEVEKKIDRLLQMEKREKKKEEARKKRSNFLSRFESELPYSYGSDND